jgi:predicted nucleotidyltransferase
MSSELSALLGSEARAAVLSRLLLQPDTEMHVRDLVRATGFSPRSISKEVERLTGAGFLLERRSSNRRYLRANQRHPLFRPVREILEKTIGIVPTLRAVLSEEADIKLALLFGSAAAGTEKAESDIDLLVVGTVSLGRTIALTRPVQEKLGREVNPIVMTTREFCKRRADKEHFISSVLNGKHITLIGDLRELG